MKTVVQITLLLLFFCQMSSNARSDDESSWIGYDYSSKTEIEIGKLGPGNQPREGLVFQFYDSKDDNYHTAKVLLIQSIAGGTEIRVDDLDMAEERTFIME